jgi:hypothetical protein
VLGNRGTAWNGGPLRLVVPLFVIFSRWIVRMADVIQKHDFSLAFAMGAGTGDLKQHPRRYGCCLHRNPLTDRRSMVSPECRRQEIHDDERRMPIASRLIRHDQSPVPAFDCVSFHTNDAARPSIPPSKDNLKSGPGKESPRHARKKRRIGCFFSCLAWWGALSPRL